MCVYICIKENSKFYLKLSSSSERKACSGDSFLIPCCNKRLQCMLYITLFWSYHFRDYIFDLTECLITLFCLLHSCYFLNIVTNFFFPFNILQSDVCMCMSYWYQKIRKVIGTYWTLSVFPPSPPELVFQQLAEGLVLITGLGFPNKAIKLFLEDLLEQFIDSCGLMEKVDFCWFFLFLALLPVLLKIKFLLCWKIRNVQVMTQSKHGIIFAA